VTSTPIKKTVNPKVSAATTAEREPDQALRESEEHFRALVENIGDVVARFDPDCRFLYANQVCTRYIEQEPEALIGRTHTEIGIAEKEAAHMDSIIRRVFNTGIPEEHKITISVTIGQRIFNWRVFPEFSSDGAVRSVVTLSRDITEQEQIAHRLAQQSKRVRAVSRRLVEIQESERRRLSAELHDLLGQNLTALGINLDIVHGELSSKLPATVADRVMRMRAIVGEMVDTVRMVVSDLRPASLDSYGLAGALHSYAQIVADRTRFEVRISTHGTELRLEPEVELALFRIAQEALQNAAKHSGTTAAHIELSGEPEAVRMIVSDDGCGFRADVERRINFRGFGLMLMQERADAIGATLSTETEPGQGTRVVVEMARTDDDTRIAR
jgi:PAS domain S-box-containing protein